mmetsp:Transcript_47180/g.148070  ORF Transcript_47180/g.148070 Transcript_47180/m.148070 type:complete len:213 (+) Transcript_47180:1109-1747(+)
MTTISRPDDLSRRAATARGPWDEGTRTPGPRLARSHANRSRSFCTPASRPKCAALRPSETRKWSSSRRGVYLDNSLSRDMNTSSSSDVAELRTRNKQGDGAAQHRRLKPLGSGRFAASAREVSKEEDGEASAGQPPRRETAAANRAAPMRIALRLRRMPGQRGTASEAPRQGRHPVGSLLLVPLLARISPQVLHDLGQRLRVDPELAEADQS